MARSHSGEVWSQPNPAALVCDALDVLPEDGAVQGDDVVP